MKVACICILLCVPYHLHAFQQPEYLVQQWGLEHGLPQSTVRCITQTPDGYIWVGTWNGLARFDGVKFTIFNSRNTPVLTVSNIMSLFTDSRGRMWVGMDSGGLAYVEDGNFSRMDSTMGFSATRILSINEDRDGRVWFATEIGIFVFNGERFQHFTQEDGLIRTYANQVKPLSDGSMYLGFVGDGSRVRLDGNTLSVVETFRVGGYQIAIDSADVYWYSIPGQGFIRRQKGQEKIHSRMTDEKIRETYTVRHGEQWLVTASDIRIFSGAGVEDLVFEGITTVFEDREGLIWMGQERGGLIRLREKRVQVLSSQNGFPFERVTSGMQDRSGNVWIATWDNGLFRSTDSSLTSYLRVPLPDTVLTVNTLHEGKDGTIYAGTWGDGLFAIRHLRPKKIIGDVLTEFHSIISVVEDNRGDLWVGTAHDGVIQFKDGNEIVWNTDTGLSSNRINSILVARNGDMWITASANGVNRISNGVLTVYKKGSGLNDNMAAPLYEDEDGAIWIGTNRGLNRWADGAFHYVTADQGLGDEQIGQIMEDDIGHFWIGAIRGIYRVSKQELNAAAEGTIPTVRYFSFGKEDGMLSEETGGGGTPRSWKTSDGRLWFTSKGVVIVDPKTATDNTVPPNVILEDVWVENQPRPLATSIILQPGETKIEFRYTGTNFTAPSKIRFSHFLEGFDEEWNDVGNQRTVRYTNLAPGSYRLMVKAQNSAGVWSLQDATMDILVLPPFYATWWFRTLVILGLLSLVFVLYWRRISILKLEQKRQQEFSLRLIEEQESERQRIAHELHDSLGQNLLVLKNQVLLAEQEHEQVFLQDMSSLISQSLQEVRSISHNLRPHQLDQLGISKAIRALAKTVSQSVGIPIETEIDDIDSLLNANEDISLFRILQEGLNNIIKHAAATSASIHIKKTSRLVTVTIQDNGKGMDLTDMQSKEDFGHGFGLSGMRERCRLFGWTFQIESQPNQGTVVSIHLPIKEKVL